MAFGIETYRSDMSVAMSGANKAGVFIDILLVPHDSYSGSKVYYQIPAGAMFVVAAGTPDGGNHTFTIDSDGAGSARINWKLTVSEYSPAGSFSRFIIFAKRVSNPETFGVDLPNAQGDQLADITFPVPQYAGKVTPSTYPTRAYSYDSSLDPNDTERDIFAYEHTARMNFRPDTNRVVVVLMPDSSNNDVWYSCESFIPAGSGEVTLTLTAYMRSPRSYLVPSLHIFSLDGPISGGSTFGIQYQTATTKLVYDSSAENISIKDIQPVSYGDNFDAPQAVALDMAQVAGITLPYVTQGDFVGATDTYGIYNYYRGISQRRGNTMYFKKVLVEAGTRIYGSTTGDFQRGSTEGFLLSIDLGSLGATISQIIPQ